MMCICLSVWWKCLLLINHKNSLTNCLVFFLCILLLYVNSFPFFFLFKSVLIVDSYLLFFFHSLYISFIFKSLVLFLECLFSAWFLHRSSAAFSSSLALCNSACCCILLNSSCILLLSTSAASALSRCLFSPELSFPIFSGLKMKSCYSIREKHLFIKVLEIRKVHSNIFIQTQTSC